ncbi:uncharacterized protein TNCV_980041 [Trichonephila clavipes]|uniref:Uncharacterized protein n=1 Tax=Trichonephila clavipes TaxID=2585209 RepID=A0A8X6RXN7_TRICX|nr:uncharacterized protein TNCV_980041 [Trichonephila clavipes]
MLWTYRWAVMVQRINTSNNRVLKAIAPHTITPAVGVVYGCKAKAGLRRSPLARHILMVREDTRAPNEGATYAWMTADKVVGCTRAFLTMWWSSRQLVCRKGPKPGFRVNEISRIHWSQHLLTIQSEWPN